MENLYFRNSFMVRVFKHTDFTIEFSLFVLLSMILMVFFKTGPSFASILTGGYACVSLIYLLNSVYQARFYLKEIMIDEQTDMCYIQYYDINTLKKEQIRLKNLRMKLKTVNINKPWRAKDKKLYIYNREKTIVSQICGLGYWKEDICKEMIYEYISFQKKTISISKNYKQKYIGNRKKY